MDKCLSGADCRDSDQRQVGYVPQGKIMGSGIMVLQIVNSTLLKAVNKTGGFGGSEWKKVK
jgi:ABC-type Mn2+/Zn2+ transport system ATPase subunit